MTRDDILIIYEDILKVITDFFQSEDKAVLWMSSKNTLLGGISPTQMIIDGRSDKLLKFIFNALDENRREGEWAA